MRSTGVSFLLLLALLGACSSSDRGLGTAVPVTDAAASAPAAPLEPTPGEPEAPAEPTLASVECSDPPDADTECFELTTAADRDDATHGRSRCRSRPPGPPAGLQPVVIPGGGPGFPATTGAGYWANHALRTDHDIVLYDQRGTGGARPSLECPERDEEVIATLQSAEPPPTDRFAIAEASLVCQARLEAEGIDLNDYDTASSAADLDDLRVALGYERWTILGISYGSRLALESMRLFPDGLASVILDSVYDVDQGGLAATIASGERAIAELTSRTRDWPMPSRPLGRCTTPCRGTARSISVDGNGPQHFVITGDDLIGGVFQRALRHRGDPAPAGHRPRSSPAVTRPSSTRCCAGPRVTSPVRPTRCRLSVDCADNAGLGRWRQPTPQPRSTPDA